MIEVLNNIIYTDWNQIDPHYFYMRGAIWGIVVTIIIWTFFKKKKS